MRPRSIIPLFDDYLHKQGEVFEAVVVGGTALAIMGIIQRETQDCDILDPKIPDRIEIIAREFASEVSQQGILLKDNWLNNGPVSLRNDLPQGWKGRAHEIYKGRALVLFSLGREDLLKAKIFAFCDREQDRGDCINLNPSKEELSELKAWLVGRDVSPGWALHIEASLRSLAKDLGHEF